MILILLVGGMLSGCANVSNAKGTEKKFTVTQYGTSSLSHSVYQVDHLEIQNGVVGFAYEGRRYYLMGNIQIVENR